MVTGGYLGVATLSDLVHYIYSLKVAYARVLRDEELRSHLDRGDTVVFTEDALNWHELERQIEKLGFGELYAVSCGSKLDSKSHTRVSPLRAQAA